MNPKNQGPAMGPAPFFAMLMILTAMLAAAGCSQTLEDLGFENENKREAHTISPLVPMPNEQITRKDGIAPQPTPDRMLTPEQCHRITEAPIDNVLVIVERVVDGDTIRAVNLPEPLRLWGIDAPETEQPGGEQATAFLESAVAPGDILLAQQIGTDIYGRKLVSIRRENETNINYLMVERGWAFPYYGPGDPPNSCLESAQRFARTHRTGLWLSHENGGTRPWEWRKENPR